MAPLETEFFYFRHRKGEWDAGDRELHPDQERLRRNERRRLRATLSRLRDFFSASALRWPPVKLDGL